MEITITAAERERFSWVAKAAANDKTYPHLCGVRLDGTGDKWRAVATDAYRLHETTFDVEAPGKAGAVGWVGFEHAKAVSKTKGGESTRIAIEDYGVSIGGQITPTLEAQFPDYAQLWPGSHENECQVFLPDFTVKGGKNAPATLRYSADHSDLAFVLNATNRQGDIGVNPEFFCDAVAGRGYSTVRTISPFRPIVVERVNERALLMPIRLNR